MNAQQLQDKLKELGACEGAIKWASGKDLQTAWETCERGDWMLWLLINLPNEATDKQLRLISVDCARQVQHLMKDERSLNALDVAERYANGNATGDELNIAREAAAAARATASAASWEAAWAAWVVAGVTIITTAWALARKKEASIIRKHIPTFKQTP